MTPRFSFNILFARIFEMLTHVIKQWLLIVLLKYNLMRYLARLDDIELESVVELIARLL
jgi:hypothetical protein